MALWRNAISQAGALENIQDEPEASYSARKKVKCWKKKKRRRRGRGMYWVKDGGQSERAPSGKSWNNQSKKAVQCWILTQSIK